MGHKGRKGNRGQITNSRLLFVRIFNDFRTVARQNAIKDPRMILNLAKAEGVADTAPIRDGQDPDCMAPSIRAHPARELHTRHQLLRLDSRGIGQVPTARENELVIRRTLETIRENDVSAVRGMDLCVLDLDRQERLLLPCLLDPSQTPPVPVPDTHVPILERTNRKRAVSGHENGLGGHAQIRRLDGAEILLVRLGVGRILVQQIGCAGLDLAVEDALPEFAGLDLLAPPPLPLVALIEVLEGRAPDVGEARGLGGAKERPRLVRLDPLHEEVGNPKGVEEVPGPLLLGSRRELEFEKVLDVGVPGLEVNGKGAVALGALVDVAGRGVEIAEHRDNARGGAAVARNVGPTGPDIVNVEADAAGVLANLGTVAQGLVNSGDAVARHLEEVARRHLGPGSPRIKQGRRGVDELLGGEKGVGLEDLVDARGAPSMARGSPKRHGHPHPQVLRPLQHLAR